LAPSPGGGTALRNGNFVVRSPGADGTMPSTADSGVITYGNGIGNTTGLIGASNSVLGTAAYGGGSLVFSYDLTRDHLIVGRRRDNIVTIFSDLSLTIFANGFENSAKRPLQAP
jgi:hypothetical protein